MAQDILDLIQEEHVRIRRLFAEVNEAAADERDDLFRHLVAELASHEAAEEAVVHPTLRDDVPGGEAEANSLLSEESAAEDLLADIEELNPSTTDFVSRFQQLERAVLTHANHEEAEEHPRLREHVDAERRRDMAVTFEQLKRVGPTHPHPRTPQEPAVRAAAGPLAGIFDRARDAVREALDR